MKIVAIMGSYRKGKTIDTLLHRAIDGAKAANSGVDIEKVTLIDKQIEYCKNCMVCRTDDPEKSIARCVIADDMQAIYPLLDAAEAFMFGTPVNMGHETAIMKTFLERICWVLAKPAAKSFPIKGTPEPRTTRKKTAIIIVSSGIVPPLFRKFCDEATALIKSVCKCSLNTTVIGNLYAGDIDHRGRDIYLEKAYALGQKLAG